MEYWRALTVQQTQCSEDLDGARVDGDDTPTVPCCAEDGAPDGRTGRIACDRKLSASVPLGTPRRCKRWACGWA